MQTSWVVQQSDPAVVAALVAKLQLQPATAQVLAVRGFADPSKAREMIQQLSAGK